MAQINGKYQHEKSENLDEYYKAIGIPYIPRKMILMTNPTLEVASTDDGSEFTITTATMMRTTVVKCKLGEPYDEPMPGGVLKSTTTKQDSKLLTHSIGPNGEIVDRNLEFDENGCTLVLIHEKSGIIAKRCFTRV